MDFAHPISGDIGDAFGAHAACNGLFILRIPRTLPRLEPCCKLKISNITKRLCDADIWRSGGVSGELIPNSVRAPLPFSSFSRTRLRKHNRYSVPQCPLQMPNAMRVPTATF